MSLKDIINKKIGVTHATVLVFIWVAMEAMEQFDLYRAIPIENIVFFVVVIITVLKSKNQDHSNQQLLTVEGDKIEVTTEFDSLMRSMRGSLDKYERFFKRTKAIVDEMPDYEKEDLVEGLKEAAREVAEETIEVVSDEVRAAEDSW